jgi:hypothetical protein
MPTSSSGKSGRCSRPETNTESAKEKDEYEYFGNLKYSVAFSSSILGWQGMQVDLEI